ncbi:cytochrome P450 [Pseudonocardia alaniniphila]|uniref:Cytochrome P450 n=1 Tax=Pseudonocardia alaniniphila TaxID=75291 RepID=A0ABS9TP70_9PSEU|nr:cytochrome P450 [Pseudonocardia alaniniphila]MCH6170306.1 cytochrome P450 [Pseudonocardia alaniniphila]
MTPTSITTGRDGQAAAEPAYPMVRTCPFDPPAELAQLRAENPVGRVRLWDGSSPWLITRYEDVRRILSDPRVSSETDRPGYPIQSEAMRIGRVFTRSFIGMDDPKHARYRKMITSDFTARSTEALRPVVEKLVNDLLDEMEHGPRPVDLVKAFALPLPSMVICHMLGVPYPDHAFFQSCSRALLDTTAGPEAATRANEELWDYLTDLLAAKEAEPTDDILGRLAQRYIRTGLLSRDDAVCMATLLLVAGHETTANMIALGTLTLLEHPEQAAEVREGGTAVVKSAVEELLRLWTVLHTGRRRVALEDIEIGGVTIRAGEGIIAASESANRDSAVFASPDELDIHRGSNHHVAFGFGVHQCLGQPLARLELQMAYPALLRRFPGLHLAVPLEEIRFRDKMVVYGVQELPVSW